VTGPRIAILDYGVGNLRSVEKAVARVGAAAEITSDHGRVAAADGLILPGVGAFPRAMEAIRERGLDQALRARVSEGVPTLGVCLGMQLLFERSVELGGSEGLGLLDGVVQPIGGPGLKLPQIGWNSVSWTRASRLTTGLADPCAFYHVHSFAPRPTNPVDVLGTAVYGGEFVSAVEREPLYGAQFHPEKSGQAGLRLMSNFVAICGARAPLASAA
jgi:imidazole glycerol-phosphate synthase subunit HisH